MKVRTLDDCLIYSDIGPFDLDATLLSGQAFRWVPTRQGYEGVIGQSLVQVWQVAGELWAKTGHGDHREKLVSDYFSLEFPLQEALQSLGKDSHLQEALTRHPGIRLLRQEPWECLASFLLAINKNIPHITKSIAALCAQLGPSIVAGEKVYRGFPSPEIVARTSEDELRATKMGFRARYLKAAAEKIVSEKIDLVGWRQSPYPEVRQFLMTFFGVGPKVADCVCLFSMDKWEAFPVDVWIGRVMERYYGCKQPMRYDRMGEIARQHFGNLAGLAQQYLYHDIRNRNQCIT